MSAAIWIVESDRENQESLEQDLEMEGYQIHSVQTGQEALEVLAEKEIGLIVLEVTLPDMSGAEVMR